MTFTLTQRYRFYCGVGSVLCPLAAIWIWASAPTTLMVSLPIAVQLCVAFSGVALLAAMVCLAVLGLRTTILGGEIKTPTTNQEAAQKDGERPALATTALRPAQTPQELRKSAQ